MTRKILISLVMSLICCVKPVPEPLSLTFLIDCSSSMSGGKDLIERDLIRAARWWADEAVERRRGRFEVMLVGNGIDDVNVLFSKKCPRELAVPIYKSKKAWLTTIQKELKDLTTKLPSNGGSALIEGIFRASNRLSEMDGEKILIISSDFRHVNDHFNFELSVPDQAMINEWVQQQHLTPTLNPIKVLVTGFRPYPPNRTTSRIKPRDYGELREVWLSLFKEWGAEVELRESLSLKILMQVTKNEEQN